VSVCLFGDPTLLGVALRRQGRRDMCCVHTPCIVSFHSGDISHNALLIVTASITIGSEYIGRVAVADGKE
jgi:hypothetical protein